MTKRNRIESYKKSAPGTDRKRVNFKLKLIRNSIINEESKIDWCQYILNDYKIDSNDTHKTFSRKVSLILCNILLELKVKIFKI